MKRKFAFLIFLALFPLLTSLAQLKPFDYMDVFGLQYATDPQIHPDGEWLVYRRMGFDILKDQAEGELWMLRADGSDHQKLTSREASESSPRWSPSGDRLAFVSSTDDISVDLVQRVLMYP